MCQYDVIFVACPGQLIILHFLSISSTFSQNFPCFKKSHIMSLETTEVKVLMSLIFFIWRHTRAVDLNLRFMDLQWIHGRIFVDQKTSRRICSFKRNLASSGFFFFFLLYFKWSIHGQRKLRNLCTSATWSASRLVTLVPQLQRSRYIRQEAIYGRSDFWIILA